MKKLTATTATTKATTAPTTTTFTHTKGESIPDYIARNNIHETITRSLLRKIASNPKNRRSTTCLNLLKNGFGANHDEILNDLYNDMFITLLELANNNHIAIDTNNGYGIVFSETQEEKTYIVDCYKSIDRTFSKFANPKFEFPNTDLVTIDYDNNNDNYSDNNHIDSLELSETITTRNYNSPDYLYKVVDSVNNEYDNNTIDTLKDNKEFLQVWCECKQQFTPKILNRLEEILLLLLNGNKKQDVIKSLNISENQYNFCVGKFRKIYKEQKQENESNFSTYIKGEYLTKTGKKKSYTYHITKGNKGDYKPITGTIYSPTCYGTNQNKIILPEIKAVYNSPVDHSHDSNKAIVNAVKQRERLKKIDMSLHNARMYCGTKKAINKPKQDILNSKPHKLAAAIKNKKIARVKLLSE